MTRAAPLKAVSPDLARLLEDPARVAEIPDGEVRQVLLRVSALLTALSAKIGTPAKENGQPEAPAKEELEHLTVPEVAAILRLPKARIYELIRQGEVPALGVGEKNVRVSRADLRAWIAQHQKNGLDTPLRVTHSAQYDRFRGVANSKALGPNPSPARRTSRRNPKQRGPLGARRVGDPRIGRPTPPAPSERGTEGKA
jgi:excisionase family DNA binding protein